MRLTPSTGLPLYLIPLVWVPMVLAQEQTGGEPSPGAGFLPPSLYYIGAVVAIVVILAVASRASRRRAQRKRARAQPARTHRRRKKRH